MRTFIASTAVLRIGSVALLQRAPLRISKAVARALIVRSHANRRDGSGRHR